MVQLFLSTCYLSELLCEVRYYGVRSRKLYAVERRQAVRRQREAQPQLQFANFLAPYGVVVVSGSHTPPFFLLQCPACFPVRQSLPAGRDELGIGGCSSQGPLPANDRRIPHI